MTLEETVYWIVMIFFALPIALGALLYLWRMIADIFFPRRQQEEAESLEHMNVEDKEDEEFRG